MSLADAIAGGVAAARNVIVAGKLQTQAKITVNANHRPYDPVADTTTETGTTLPVPVLRYAENSVITKGLRAHGHYTDGLVAKTQKALFFSSDLQGNTIKQDDLVWILGDDMVTWEQWQIVDVSPPPTRPMWICTIEKA
jgi:hypothetical protein